MKAAPCKGCEKRQPYCHSTCNDYCEWRRYVEKIRKGEKRLFDVDSMRAECVLKFRQQHAGEHHK